MSYITVSDFPEDKIYVLLSKSYRKKLIYNLMRKFNSKNYFELSLCINKNLKTKLNGGDVRYWIEGERLDKRDGKIYPKFMPLWLVIRLIKFASECIETLQKNIISYRSGSSGLVITNPIIPIRVSPELDSILIHLFGDGAAGDFTPSYTQKNKVQVDNFIKKIENCFGCFEKSNYLTQGKHQVKFPKAITDILSSYYSVNSYRSYESIIPPIILDSPDRKRKLACIIAFIVDEGGIRDVVSFYSANKTLLSGIRQLVLSCKYPCSKIKKNNEARSYTFNMSNKCIERFVSDVKKLSMEFSTCNLSFKESELDFIIKRRMSSNPKNSAITQKAVLDSLITTQFSAQQISKLTGYAYCTVVHTLERLYRAKKVDRIKAENKTYLWRLY